MIQLLQKTVSKYRDSYWEDDIIFLLTILSPLSKDSSQALKHWCLVYNHLGITDDLNTRGCKGFHPSLASASHCGDRECTDLGSHSASKKQLLNIAGEGAAFQRLYLWHCGEMCHSHKKKEVPVIDKQPKGRGKGEV